MNGYAESETEGRTPTLDFDVLGPLEIRCGADRLEPGPPRQRAILALVLINVGRVVPIEAIIDTVWGESPPAGVTSTIQAYVSRLRRVLSPAVPGRDGEGVLRFQSRGYVLDVAPEQASSHRFEKAANQGCALLRDDEPAAADRCLADALRLWRGAPYGDLANYAFVADEAFRLQQIRVTAVDALASAGLLQGSYDSVISLLSQEISGNPLNEHLVGHLMLALDRSGRAASALQLYERTRARLAEEFGVGVSAGLRELHAAILRQESVRPARR